VTNDRSSPEFADCLLDVAARYTEADTIHWVMDNLSSHTRKANVLGRARRLAVESVHRALYPEARELVEPGGDRDQFTLPAMLGPTPDRGSSVSAEENAGVEPPHESRPSHDPVGPYSHPGSQEVGYKITRSRYVTNDFILFRRFR